MASTLSNTAPLQHGACHPCADIAPREIADPSKWIERACDFWHGSGAPASGIDRTGWCTQPDRGHRRALRKSRVESAADWAAIEALVRAEYGRLDIVFANAGIEGGDGSIESIDLEAWERIVSINLTGVMLTAKSAVALMRDNPGGAAGSIIINSSMSAHRAMGNFIAYSTTKTAVLALCKSVALHCATQGLAIRCNAILPGVVETDMIRGVIDRAPDPVAARGMFEGMAPMKRMAQVSEVAALVAFLASDEAAFISGAEYLIDGATLSGAQGV